MEMSLRKEFLSDNSSEDLDLVFSLRIVVIRIVERDLIHFALANFTNDIFF